MDYRIERLTFGGILDQAFRLLRDHFVQMIAAFVVLYVPLRLIGDIQEENLAAMQAGTPGAGSIGGMLFSMLLILVIALLVPLAQLVVTATILDAYLGRPVQLRDALARARASYLPYVGTTFLLLLFLMLWTLLFVVPGVYFMICWMLVGPVAVMENTFGRAALRRSRELVRDHFWRTAGITFVAGVLAAVVGGGLGVLFNFIPVLGGALTGFVESVTAAYTSAALVVLYIDLRARHENFDLELLANQVAAQDSLRPAAAIPGNAPHP